MAENFKEMLDEQKKTNQLLVQLNEDPSLASSIKQNLGEILNARLLAGRDETYQKKEGVTEVDEKVEETTSAIADLHEDTVESFNALQSVISDGQTPASALEEANKDERGFFRSQFDILGGTFKGFRKDFEGFKKTFGAGGSMFGGGIGRKLLAFGGLAAGLLLLKEEHLLKAAEILDKTVLPFLKIIGEKVGNIVGPRLKKLMDDTIAAADDPEKGAFDVLFDKTNATTILGAVALIYSRTITAFALSTAFRMFKPSSMVGFYQVTSNVLSRMFYGKGGAAGFAKMSRLGKIASIARGSGILAVVAGLYGAVTNAFGAEAERRRKELELTRGDQAVGGFFGQIVGGINEMIGMFIGIFDKDLGEKFQDEMGVDATTQAAELLSKRVRTFLTDFFDFIFGGLRKLFFGKDADETAEALEKQIKLRRKKEEQIAKKEEMINKNVEKGKLEGKNLDREINQLVLLKEDLEQIDNEVRTLGSDLQNLGVEADNLNLLPNIKLTEDELAIFRLSKNLDKVPFDEKFLGGGVRKGSIALIGEGPGGRGGELVYSGSDAMVMNQSRTDALLTMALEKGLSGGGGEGAPVVVTTDNSVRSNTSNMISSPPIVTSNDTFTNAIASSV